MDGMKEANNEKKKEIEEEVIDSKKNLFWVFLPKSRHAW